MSMCNSSSDNALNVKHEHECVRVRVFVCMRVCEERARVSITMLAQSRETNHVKTGSCVRSSRVATSQWLRGAWRSRVRSVYDGCRPTRPTQNKKKGLKRERERETTKSNNNNNNNNSITHHGEEAPRWQGGPAAAAGPQGEEEGRGQDRDEGFFSEIS